MYNQHLQGTRSVNSLNTIKLNIRSCRGARDKCERSMVTKRCFCQACDSLWHKINDLLLENHTKMIVGQQGDYPPPLCQASVQNNRASRGNSKCAAS